MFMRSPLVMAYSLMLVASVSSQEPSPPDWVLDRTNTTLGAATLVKSLDDALEMLQKFQPSSSREEWQARRGPVLDSLRASLGLRSFPLRSPLNAKVVSQHSFEGFNVENIVFESRPNFLVTANVYVPAGNGPQRRPAVLCPIGHYLADGKSHPEVQACCIQLAKMGFVVLVYDAIGQGERLTQGNIHHHAGYCLLPLGETIAGWMVWDSIRAIDYLQSRDDVDPSNIGITGNSGGGMNSLLTAAIDDRIAAAVVVGFTFEFKNWMRYGGTHCTCTHWPEIFSKMEWFEIAGLIAPRSLMLIQGELDPIFLNSGARRAAQATEHVFSLMDAKDQFRFVELPGLPHSYSHPFREASYEWFRQKLQRENDHAPLSEPPFPALEASDSRLRCDPKRRLMSESKTVVEIARELAIQRLKAGDFEESALREQVVAWLAPPLDGPHNMLAKVIQPKSPEHGESILFQSEDGQPLRAKLWKPNTTGASRVLIVVSNRVLGPDDSSASESESDASPSLHLIQPLLKEGWAIFAVELRGSGASLGRYSPSWNTHFRLVANQTLSGKPLVGRKGFDLRRSIDYLASRQDIRIDELTVIGMEDEALPVMFAALLDDRIKNVAICDFLHSMVSCMADAKTLPGSRLSANWNDAQLTGSVEATYGKVDFQTLVPNALRTFDFPFLLALIKEKGVLFCQARDREAPLPESVVQSYRLLAEVNNNFRYMPNEPFSTELLRTWLHGDSPKP